jgi:predicted Zn-dependent protease
MFGSLLKRLLKRKTARNIARNRHLVFLQLEERAMMAGIPQLSSLTGAAQTIFLDFDGDTQQTWNRTDASQTYTNVVAGEFKLDNTAGISDAEESVIRKIWETVADDFAPFNVNVTTVAPASFADRVALRVVMAGDTSATLTTNAGTTFNSGTRDVFISDDSGVMLNTSGYAAINSYTNTEVNVVYVFAKYINTWSTTDSEGRYRDLRAVMANTASHEAGHAFGLEHHGNYDVGTILTTPIMGSNTQGDRTLWSTYTVGSTTYDSVSRLANLFGTRPDDFSNSLTKASEFPMTYNAIYGWTGVVQGVISGVTDADVFRLTTSTTNTYKMTVTVPQFGNLDSQLAIYNVRKSLFGAEMYTLVSVVDPAITQYHPFSGLGATTNISLGAGTWAIVVRSHGSYGDIGNYRFSITIPSSQPYIDLKGTVLTAGTTTSTMTSSANTLPITNTTSTATKAYGGAPSSSLLNDAFSSKQVKLPVDSSNSSKIRKLANHTLRDSVFAAWPSRG